MQIEFDQYLSLLSYLDEETNIKIRKQYLQIENNLSKPSKQKESQRKLLKSLIQIFFLIVKTQLIFMYVIMCGTQSQNCLANLQWMVDNKQKIQKINISLKEMNQNEDDVLVKLVINTYQKKLSQKCNKSTINCQNLQEIGGFINQTPQYKGPWVVNVEFQFMKTMLNHRKNWQIVASEMKNQRTENSANIYKFKFQKA
ncbi:unnamed protein product (macronuclear) [Paramecium tetraurelia]|uniref:Transmembrane protein n=1 Tax=Paramecium tetraurelia TaxID=5888 RepID=A0BVN8_PARTE|nr:uncharacterized protein GSPATT00032457001 [Paramecium tetraurelia]CAK62605.1 unnamed protein product [Paramecium tetraurelia]|eukprot:XP_001430003.1 hypothetical protein (macronuclear) [Paramecium tetraurelia strain d4-2]